MSSYDLTKSLIQVEYAASRPCMLWRKDDDGGGGGVGDVDDDTDGNGTIMMVRGKFSEVKHTS